MKQYKIKCDSCQSTAINGIACHENGCTGLMTYQYRGKTYIKYAVYSLDVWGNTREGFEVNNRSKCASVMIPYDSNDKQIIRALKQNGLLNSKCRFNSFKIDGDQGLLMVDARKTSEPIYQLEAA